MAGRKPFVLPRVACLWSHFLKSGLAPSPQRAARLSLTQRPTSACLSTSQPNLSSESRGISSRAFSSQSSRAVGSLGRKNVFAETSNSAGGESLRRAGTLLLNDPPPSYELSIHHGLKVQASLLLQRLPTVYEEPAFEREFREFKLNWERQTGHAPVLSDEVTFMQFPFQFLETKAQEESREKRQQATGDADLSEIDRLLQQEGLSLKRTKREKARLSRKEEDVGRWALFWKELAAMHFFSLLTIWFRVSACDLRREGRRQRPPEALPTAR